MPHDYFSCLNQSYRCRSRSRHLCLNIFCIYLKESNQLHAVCQDTYPPITPPYMNSTSHRIVQLVTEYNNFYGFPKVFCNSPYHNLSEVISILRFAKLNESESELCLARFSDGQGRSCVTHSFS